MLCELPVTTSTNNIYPPQHTSEHHLQAGQHIPSMLHELIQLPIGTPLAALIRKEHLQQMSGDWGLLMVVCQCRRGSALVAKAAWLSP